MKREKKRESCTELPSERGTEREILTIHLSKLAFTSCVTAERESERGSHKMLILNDVDISRRSNWREGAHSASCWPDITVDWNDRPKNQKKKKENFYFYFVGRPKNARCVVVVWTNGRPDGFIHPTGHDFSVRGPEKKSLEERERKKRIRLLRLHIYQSGDVIL